MLKAKLQAILEVDQELLLNSRRCTVLNGKQSPQRCYPCVTAHNEAGKKPHGAKSELFAAQLLHFKYTRKILVSLRLNVGDGCPLYRWSCVEMFASLNKGVLVERPRLILNQRFSFEIVGRVGFLFS